MGLLYCMRAMKAFHLTSFRFAWRGRLVRAQQAEHLPGRFFPSVLGILCLSVFASATALAEDWPQ